MSNNNDPVQRMVRVSSPEKFATWLIESHGAAESSRRILEMNIAEQMRWHRLQGRIDRQPLLVGLAELWRLRQPAETLAYKPDPNAWDTAQELCNVQRIDECLRGFSEDPTNNNAVGLIREILIEAAKGRS